MSKEIYNIKEKKCGIGTIALRSDKILTFKPFDGVTTCNLADLKEMYDIYMEITSGVPHLYYTDNTNIKGFGSEERVFVSEKFHHFALASAIKENSAIVRYITHSILYLNKPQIPLKMFKTKTDAISWLKSLKK
jgi:hypothetical protein